MNDEPDRYAGADVAWDVLTAEAYLGKTWDKRENTYAHARALHDIITGRLRVKKLDVLCRTVKSTSMCGYFETRHDRHPEPKCSICESRIAKYQLKVYE